MLNHTDGENKACIQTAWQTVPIRIHLQIKITRKENMTMELLSSD